MLAQILKILPLILPILAKLFKSIGKINQVKKTEEVSDELIHDIVDKAKKEVEAQVEKTLEEYRPSIRDTAKNLPTQEDLDREERLNELEKILIESQNKYKNKPR